MVQKSKSKVIKSSQCALRTELYLTPRVQTLGFSADLNSVPVYELGTYEPVDIISDRPTINFTIESFDYGSINFLNQLTRNHIGEIFNYNSSDGTISLLDFENAYTDFNVLVKEDPSIDLATRSCWFNFCSLDSISGKYGVDGVASESFSFSGNSQAWFLGDMSNATSCPMTFVDSTRLEVNNSSYEEITLLVSTSKKPFLYENGMRVPELNYSVTSSGIVTSLGGYTFYDYNRYRLIANIVAPSFPVPYNPGEFISIGGLRDNEIEVVMWQPQTEATPGYGIDTNEQILRIQNVEYQVGFNRQELKEIYTGTFRRPIESHKIEASIQLFATDLQLWFYGTGKKQDWLGDVTTSYISVEEFELVKNLSVRISLFRHKRFYERTEEDLLKNIILSGGTVVGVESSTSVRDKKVFTLKMEFKTISYEGTGLEGRVEQLPDFKILNFDYDGTNAIVEIESVPKYREYYYEIQHKTQNEAEWSFSEWSMVTNKSITHYIDKNLFSSQEENWNVRVRAKDNKDNTSNWKTISENFFVTSYEKTKIITFNVSKNEGNQYIFYIEAKSGSRNIEFRYRTTICEQHTNPCHPGYPGSWSAWSSPTGNFEDTLTYNTEAEVLFGYRLGAQLQIRFIGNESWDSSSCSQVFYEEEDIIIEPI